MVEVKMDHKVDKVNSDVVVTVVSNIKVDSWLIFFAGGIWPWIEVYDSKGNKVAESEPKYITKTEDTIEAIMVNPEEGVYTAYTKYIALQKEYSVRYQFLIEYEYIGNVEIKEVRYKQLTPTKMRIYVTAGTDFPPEHDEQCALRIFRDGNLDVYKNFFWSKGKSTVEVYADIERKDIKEAYTETVSVEVTRLETGYDDTKSVEVSWKELKEEEPTGFELPPELILASAGLVGIGLLWYLLGGRE